MTGLTGKLTLGSVGRLRPADEIRLADECVRRHGHDMHGCTRACDPGGTELDIGKGEVSNAMDVHEPAMGQEDPLAEDIDMGVSVTETELDEVLEL